MDKKSEEAFVIAGVSDSRRTITCFYVYLLPCELVPAYLQQTLSNWLLWETFLQVLIKAVFPLMPLILFLAVSKIIRTQNSRSKVCAGISTKGQWIYDMLYNRRKMKWEQSRRVWWMGLFCRINLVKEICNELSGTDWLTNRAQSVCLL